MNENFSRKRKRQVCEHWSFYSIRDTDIPFYSVSSGEGSSLLGGLVKGSSLLGSRRNDSKRLNLPKWSLIIILFYANLIGNASYIRLTWNDSLNIFQDSGNDFLLNISLTKVWLNLRARFEFTTYNRRILEQADRQRGLRQGAESASRLK